MAEFDALLADARAAADTVLRSWAAPPAPPAPGPVPVPAAVTTTRVVSLETMPYLRDHCFYRQPDGWPDLSDQFPVVPMTTMLELMMDAARPLAGGRTIVGLTKVRALRWLAPTEPVTLTVNATRTAEGHVDVALKGYARATVLVADRYPVAPPRGAAEPLRNERPSPVAAEDLYRGRWLFHGPGFQGVEEITGYADDGIRGRLTSLEAPGGLLDNAGQLMGFWIRTTVATDKLAFPASIERLEFFGPHPPPGQSLECTVWIRNVTDTLVTADLEVRRTDGTVWARITGWSDRRFLTDAAVDPTLRWPERSRIAEDQPGGWFLLRDRWHDPANRELVMRRYLAAEERRQYEQHNPRGRHQWLLGRMAAKDAARQWLWDRGAGDLFPAQFVVGNDEVGRPSMTGLPAGTGLSIAHAGEMAVALVGGTEGPGPGVGIDVETIADRGPEFEAMACRPAERLLLDRGAISVGSRAECLTRFWVAKEAVAKALGTGLGGRPQSFEVRQMEGSRLLVSAAGHHAPWWVDTTTITGHDGATRYAVGWTTTPATPSEEPATTARGVFPLTLVTERNTTNGR
jgi:phosphopantetheinyl transferase